MERLLMYDTFDLLGFIIVFILTLLYNVYVPNVLIKIKLN